MATDDTGPTPHTVAVTEAVVRGLGLADEFDDAMDRVRRFVALTDLEAVLVGHIAGTLYPGILRASTAHAAHDEYFWRAQAIGVPEDRARVVLDEVAAEARGCWARVDIHEVAYHRLLEGEENRPPEELRTIAREMHRHPYGLLGDDHPEAVDATARMLATLTQTEAEAAEHVPDLADLPHALTRALDTPTGPRHPPTGPRRTDSRPAWQSPYGPPRRGKR
ncbi:hypothetical protein GCM10027160_23600 [Streptomyces calidiresistens]|uniref:Uncharacterized protein n=1 Tax=Streptomyces calidiresistens TaxID=1485586 RepID=A0A7W3XXV0_9ACTN|nr:hypothetical protein [Streptomyces calidiresistens]MBB0231278.1 hypothetical protein [Streptomyces calidiresistens]